MKAGRMRIAAVHDLLKEKSNIVKVIDTVGAYTQEHFAPAEEVLCELRLRGIRIERIE